MSVDLIARARNRRTQTELYGKPLGDQVLRLTGTLGITQARLAQTLGISAAGLSQLVSAKRVRLGNPLALARLAVLDQQCAALARSGPEAIEEALQHVAQSRPHWPVSEESALRGASSPARLTAAADILSEAFPDVARVLRKAAEGSRAS